MKKFIGIVGLLLSLHMELEAADSHGLEIGFLTPPGAEQLFESGFLTRPEQQGVRTKEGADDRFRSDAPDSGLYYLPGTEPRLSIAQKTALTVLVAAAAVVGTTVLVAKKKSDCTIQ